MTVCSGCGVGWEVVPPERAKDGEGILKSSEEGEGCWAALVGVRPERGAWPKGTESLASDAIDELVPSSTATGPAAAEGDDDGGGDGNREAPPVADTWAAPWPPGAVAGAEADADVDTVTVAGAGDDAAGCVLLLEYSVTESGRWARGVEECRDRLPER